MSANQSKKSKHIPALVAAFAITAILGTIMLGVGINAKLNKNVITAQAAVDTDPIDLQSATPEELRSLIAQYQQREAQYQNELNKAASQLDEANAKVLQYENLILQLQNAGVIQINRNGQVTLTARSFNSEHESGEFWEHDD